MTIACKMLACCGVPRSGECLDPCFWLPRAGQGHDEGLQSIGRTKLAVRKMAFIDQVVQRNSTIKSANKRKKKREQQMSNRLLGMYQNGQLQQYMFGGNAWGAMQCGIPGGVSRPVSQNAWCPFLTINHFTGNQFKIILDFPCTTFESFQADWNYFHRLVCLSVSGLNHA